MKKTLPVLMAAAVAMNLLTGCVTIEPAETTAASTAQEETGSTQNASAESSSDSSQETSSDSYVIGIGQYAEHGSLDNCREGFLEGLAKEGIVEGENLTVYYENAQADGGTASQIFTNFAARDVDLFCAIATPMAQSAYSVAMKSDIPVI